jgi:hypothetical protein
VGQPVARGVMEIMFGCEAGGPTDST